MAELLKTEDVERIIHGPALRARRTAELLAAGLGSVETVESALAQDRTPWPKEEEEFTGLASHVTQWLEAVPVPERDPGGRDLDRSMKSWVRMSEHSSIVVVTHAFVVAWIAARAVGGPWDAWLRMPVDNATMTTVEPRRHGEVWLRRFNSRV